MGKVYYDEKYFEWQKKIGEFGGRANLFKFEEYIEENDDVLDFGCGGGYLLKNINTQGKKIGIEINPVAREIAKKNGVLCFDDIKKIADNSIDVLISNHALEHVDEPIIYIKEFRRVVRNGGKVVIVVPHIVSNELDPFDINMELHTWAPQNLYNLLTTCRIDTIRCERLCHAWLPSDSLVLEKEGWDEFHKISRERAKEGQLYQTIAAGVVLKGENEDENEFIRSDTGIYARYCHKIMEKWRLEKKIIEQNDRIAIYGAGIRGKRILNFLQDNAYRVDCFVISSTEKKENDINGLQVIPLDKLDQREKYLFILGVQNETSKENIKKLLESRGCNNIVDFDIRIIDCLEKDISNKLFR